MVAFIFSLIFLIAGIIIGVILVCYKEYEYQEDNYGNYVKDSSGNRIKIERHPMRKFSAIPFSVGSALFVVLLLVACLYSVDTGHTGVVTRFGQVEDYTFDSGLHGKAPWMDVIEMDNRVQKVSVELECFSSDIQEVRCSYTLNYKISKENAQTIYKTIGKDYYENVVEPNVAKAVKTIVALYTAETLVSNRDQLSREIEELLTANITPYNIEVVGTAVENLDFADNFTNAVEAKQVAVQNKLKAVTEQEQKTIEEQQSAERAKIKAGADAEVAKIQAQADMEVAKIGADSAEYQGKKEASIALQRLASINGWTVVTNNETGINEIYKADGTKVTAEEIKEGSDKLIQYYYTTQWNGILPETFVGNESASTIILGK